MHYGNENLVQYSTDKGQVQFLFSYYTKIFYHIE